MNEKQMRYVAKSQYIKKGLLTQLILFTALFFVGLTAKAGNIDIGKRITLKVENENVKNILQKIENQVDVHFMYEANQINTNQKISLKLSNVTLEQALDKICTSVKIGRAHV